MEIKFLRVFFLWLVTIGIIFARTDSVASSVRVLPPHSIINFSQAGESVELSCNIELDGSVSYQWYRSESNSNVSGMALDGANSSHYITEPFLNKEFRFYYCVATSSEGVSKSSKVFVVAYTGLPTVRINTLNGEEPSAEYAYAAENSYGRSITNVTKSPASMQIVDSSRNLVYESGEYKYKASGLTIKLRGNTSAVVGGKSSYKLKLQKKADLLAHLISRSGKSFQDKEWILHKTATTLGHVIGFTVCDIAGVPWTPKYAFVNVVINNDYRGLYLLMESVNRSESRADVSENGYIIERDAYWWNENVKFVTPLYNQKFTFKYPDDDDVSEEQLSYIEEYMNMLEQHMGDGSYDDYIDVKSFARWLLVHDFLGSWDAAGSNIFMSKYDATEKTKLRMLTNWDFDSNFMQEGKWSVQHNDERIYAASMFKSFNRTFANMYRDLYDSIAPVLWSTLEKKLKKLQEALGVQINLSRCCEFFRWNVDGVSSVEYDIWCAKKWFESRNIWLKNAIENKHAVLYELNGGAFDTHDAIPDSINFLDRIEIPQPQRRGYIFAGWTSELEMIPQKDFVLYGYNVADSVKLTANWVLDVYPIKKIDEDMSLNMDEFVGKERFSVEVFSVIGSFLGYISLYNAELHFIMKMLRNAGYANGVYILRSQALHMNHRVLLR